MTETAAAYMADRRVLVEEMLDRLLSDTVEWPAHLHRAMRYSLFPGGDWLRAVLAIAGYEALAPIPDLSAVLPVATSLELAYTSFAIHDNLPSLEDDDTRNGLPTSHRVHGEALAILSGDALQALAFQCMTDRSLYPTGLDASLLLEVTHELAVAVGEEGVAGGLSMDLGYEGDVKAAEHLIYLYAKKTGGLIRASVLCGARLGGADDDQLRGLSTFGDRMGLAYQLSDDILYHSETTDSVSGKHRPVPSIVELLGVRVTREWEARAVSEALAALSPLGERGKMLGEIAKWIPSRRG